MDSRVPTKVLELRSKLISLDLRRITLEASCSQSDGGRP